MSLALPSVAFIAPAAVASMVTESKLAPGLQEVGHSHSWSSLGLPVAVGAASFVRSKKMARAFRAARAAGEKAVPFFSEPQYWQWAKGVPGDNGFDPLNLWNHPGKDAFAAPGQDMRDAEIKHCRLAMLAAVHWPMAELLHPQIAEALRMPNKLADSGLNPSLLNGGLEDSLLQGFLAFAVVVAGFTDVSKVPGTDSGDYGFDPLNLRYAEPPVLPSIFKINRNWMAEAEITHGRLAMVAIAAFAAQEKVTQVPILLETPQIFGQ